MTEEIRQYLLDHTFDEVHHDWCSVHREAGFDTYEVWYEYIANNRYNITINVIYRTLCDMMMTDYALIENAKNGSQDDFHELKDRIAFNIASDQRKMALLYPDIPVKKRPEQFSEDRKKYHL